MKRSSISIWRALLPLSLLAATVSLLWRHQYPLPPDATGLLWLTRLDPLLLLSAWRVEGIPNWAWLPLMVVTATMLFGRVFCGWICPVGGLLAQLPRRYSRLRPPKWLDDNRYLWLIFVLVVLLLGNNWPLFLTPFHLFTAELTRLWQGKMAWVLAGILLSGIILFPRFWCIYACPTGLLFSVLSRWRPFRFKLPAICIDCRACGDVCPTRAAKPNERRITEDCMICGRCWQTCPEAAINWQRIDSLRRDDVSTKVLSRRQFFQGGLSLAAAGYSWQLLQRPAHAAVIRPPGALSETEFLAQCSRCGRCTKVCPADCLLPMPIEAGFGAFLTPQVIPRQARCDLCLLCQEVCPTGAITKVPLEQVKMGMAELNQHKCIAWTEQKLCLLCYEQCPMHALVVDDEGRPYVQENLCVGCGICENGCPLDEAAIIVSPVER